MQQANDFLEDSLTLHELLETLDETCFNRATQFKQWTVNDILVHLHVFNRVAQWSLNEPERFEVFITEVRAAAAQGVHHQALAYREVGSLRGRELCEAWHQECHTTAATFLHADPDQRVTWAGPPMTAAMSITARQMEVWSHGQEIFDLLGKTREEHDRIKNIVLLGVMTFGWTFANRGLERPAVKPYLKLTAPSGALWTFNDPSDIDCIEGLAVDFARVVTQTRNIADTDLEVTGAAGRDWMTLAQCFAGSPETPPPPGTRHRAA